jgi:hypothetical protein
VDDQERQGGEGWFHERQRRYSKRRAAPGFMELQGRTAARQPRLRGRFRYAVGVVRMCSLSAVVVLFAGAARAQDVATPFQLDAPVPWASWGVQRFPAVVFTGQEFLVAWQDDRDAVSFDVWLARVSGTGGLVAPGAPLVRLPGAQTGPALAVGASSILVAWLEPVTCGTAVFAQLHSLGLQALAPPLRLSAGCTTERPTAAWNSALRSYLVVWGNEGAGQEVLGALLTEDRSVLSVLRIGDGANAAQTPAVAAQGTGFVVVWADDRLQAGQPNIWLSTVDATGGVAAPARLSPLAAPQTTPCVAPLGNDFVAVWDEGSELVAQRFGAGNVLIGGRLSVVTGTVNRPACVEASPGLVAIAFEDGRDTGSGVFVRTVDSLGVVGPELPVAPRAGYFNRSWPQLAAGGGRLLVAAHGETDYVNGDNVVWRLVDLAGAALFPDAGVMVGSLSAAPQQRVVAAWDGTRYLAAWRDHGRYIGGCETQGQFLEAGTGRWLVDGGFAITWGTHNVASYPSVSARAGSDFFVSWGDDGSAGQLAGRTVSASTALGPRRLINDASSYVNHHVSRWFGDAHVTLFLKNGTLRVRRGDASGVTVQPETTVLETGSAPEQLSAAAEGNVLLAAWLGNDAGVDVFAARLDVDGGLLDAEPLKLSRTAGTEADPSVAGGGGLFLVAWSAPEDGGADAPRHVYVARVTPTGAVLDSPPVALGRGEQPAVGWWGTRFLVAWARDGDVVGASVEPSSATPGPTFPVAASPTIERRPFVTAGPAGEALVTFERYIDEFPFQAFRAHGVIVRDAPPGDAGLMPDGGEVPDGGSPADASVPDDGGGVADAGAVDDAGSQADGGGLPDGGEVPAGPDGGPGEVRRLSIGCGCTSVATPPVTLLLLLAWRRRATERAR